MTPGTENGRQTWPYRFEVVALDRFMVDDAYQRELTSLADEIGAGFDPAMVGTVIASERKNGKLALVDGQTRYAGARIADVTELPALIYVGMTRQDEAALFARLQRKRRNIATYQRFRAALVAREPDAVAIAKVLKPFDLVVGPRRDLDVQAVAALESVYHRDGKGDLLKRTIRVITEAWSGQPDAYAAEMIRGVARFLQGANIDDERLIQRLKDITPRRLRLRAAQLREGKGGGGHTSMYIADGLLTEYSRRK